MANKVKFGLKNCYYAVATAGTNGTYTYTTPVALAGAVSLSLEAQGDNEPFYADDCVYYMVNGNAGYNGDLELALVPDHFRTAVLNEVADANGVIYEDANAAIKHFALLFEFMGDANKTRHVMYNCTASRPAVASSTTTEAKTPSTESLTIDAKSIYVSAIDKDVVKASCTPTQATQYNAWLGAVYQPTTTATT